MRSANILSGAFCLCILLTGIAGAKTVTPGEEGELAKFLPPEPGRRICYARTYSAEHLKKHPQQTVTEVAFRLAYFRHEPDDFFPKGQRNYYFAMLAKQRGSDRTLTAMGECGPNGNRIGCGVECDGGGVSVARRPDDRILISLDRIRMSAGCDGEDAVDLEGGADDREFLLARVPDAECPAYDDW
jgi:hypothetical protein